MSEFRDVVRNRRMTRAFATTAVAPDVLDGLVDLAARAPSAGKTQGWHLVVLEGDETDRFWDISLPAEKRAGFRWQHLLDAPIIALPLADAAAYTDRYSEADKAATGLGDGPDAWPVPYWTIDTSMAVMTLLHAAEDAGLGALFFGVFHNEAALRTALGIPEGLELLGAIALGHPLDAASGAGQSDPARSDPARSGLERPDVGRSAAGQAGRSANRVRRTPDQIIHRGGW